MVVAVIKVVGYNWSGTAKECDCITFFSLALPPAIVGPCAEV
jgi:hypothetical protein